MNILETDFANKCDMAICTLQRYLCRGEFSHIKRIRDKDGRVIYRNVDGSDIRALRVLRHHYRDKYLNSRTGYLKQQEPTIPKYNKKTIMQIIEDYKQQEKTDEVIDRILYDRLVFTTWVKERSLAHLFSMSQKTKIEWDCLCDLIEILRLFDELAVDSVKLSKTRSIKREIILEKMKGFSEKWQ